MRQPPAPAAPTVSVVIGTRHRPLTVVRALRTALANDYPCFDVTIVDQSADGRIAEALAPHLQDPRVRYLRTPPCGLNSGRNAAIRRTRAELIAMTDDDCEVEVGWLAALADAFSIDRRIGMVLGNVLPGPHDRGAGFVPCYVRRAPFLARRVRDKGRVEGIGACMGIRRDVWAALGGFDEMLGPGTPFRAADEGDLAIRTLRAGYYVYETPAVSVVHHGFRSAAQAPQLVRSYWYGTGAMLAKHLRCGEAWLIPVLARLASRWAVGTSPVAASFAGRAGRLPRLRSFVSGALAGAFAPVDHRTRRYVADNGGPDSRAAGLGGHPHP